MCVGMMLKIGHVDSVEQKKISQIVSMMEWFFVKSGRNFFSLMKDLQSKYN